MPVLVMIRFPASLERQEALERSTDVMAPIAELARRHGAIGHRRIFRDGEFIDLDEWPSEAAYRRFLAEARPAIDRYESQLGVVSDDELFYVADEPSEAAATDPVASWGAIEEEAPELAALARNRLVEPDVVALGTLRADGRPRISPVNPLLLDRRLYLGMYKQSTKARDLLRDPRCTIHQPIGRAGAAAAEGEVKLYARAREVCDADEEARYLDGIEERYGWRPQHGNHVFELALQEVAYVRLDDDADGTPEILRWTPGAPAARRRLPRA